MPGKDSPLWLFVSYAYSSYSSSYADDRKTIKRWYKSRTSFPYIRTLGVGYSQSSPNITGISLNQLPFLSCIIHNCCLFLIDHTYGNILFSNFVPGISWSGVPNNSHNISPSRLNQPAALVTFSSVESVSVSANVAHFLRSLLNTVSIVHPPERPSVFRHLSSMFRFVFSSNPMR